MASRRTSEELIFDGKVTVNGSLCTAPQVKKKKQSFFFVMWGRWLVLFCLCCRLVLIQRETLSMLMGIVCPRSFLQRFILLSTSLKGSSFHNMFSLVASCYSTCNLCLLFGTYHGRYICSSGEKETKSVISLFDEFMASWVINKTAIFSYCYVFFFFLLNV